MAYLISRFSLFWKGFFIPRKAFFLILHQRKLFLWSLFPIFLTLGVYFFFFRTAQDPLLSLFHLILLKMGLNPSGTFSTVLSAIIQIILFIISIFTFSLVINLVSCPINDFLAEASEPFASPPLREVLSPSIGFRLKIIWLDFIKTAFAIFIQLLFFLLSWVPFLNFVLFLATLFFLAFQFVSFPQTRRGIGLRESLLFIKKHPYSFLGFGTSLMVLFSIPVVSWFCIPVAVVGGTLLFAETSAAETSAQT